jgi:hypothetical protein
LAIALRSLAPGDRRTAMRSGLIVGGATWALGFGVLLAFWLGSRSWSDLPGLFNYRSATVGDGLLLPLFAGALVCTAVLLGPAPGDRRWSGLAAVLGGCVAAATQVLWLLDPDPRLNWTLPEPHHFNAAGWYHAAFLVAASAAVAALSTLVLVRWRHTRQVAPEFAAEALAGSGPFLLLFLGLSFAALVLVDNVAAQGTLAGRTTTMATALAIAILGAMLTALIGFSWPLAVNLLLVLLGVAGFTAAVSSRGQRTALFALVAVGCSAAVAFALSWAMRTAGERRWALVGLSLAALLVGGLTTGSPPPPGLVLWPGLGLAVTWALLRLSAPGTVPNGLHWWASFYVVALIALARWIGAGALGEGQTQAAMAVVILLFFLVFAVIQADYHRAAGFDQSVTAPVPPEPSRVPRSWVSLAPFAAAAVIAYFFFILPAARAANFKTETATTSWGAPSVVVGPAGGCPGRRGPPPERSPRRSNDRPRGRVRPHGRSRRQRRCRLDDRAAGLLPAGPRPPAGIPRPVAAGRPPPRRTHHGVDCHQPFVPAGSLAITCRVRDRRVQRPGRLRQRSVAHHVRDLGRGEGGDASLGPGSHGGVVRWRVWCRAALRDRGRPGLPHPELDRGPRRRSTPSRTSSSTSAWAF